MMNQKSFGRRSIPQQQPSRGGQKADLPAPVTKPVLAEVSADKLSAIYRQLAVADAGTEPKGFEPSVKRRFKVPWRQVALMASFCFGVASFVLPDSLNNELDWLLYGLMAISGYVGFSGRFQS